MTHVSSESVRASLISIAALVFAELVDLNALVLCAAVAITTIAAFTAGPRLPHGSRVFGTILIVYFAFEICLVGRTMLPGFSTETLLLALTYFACFAALPTISLLRMWSRPVGLLLAVTVLPLTLLSALGLAALEEHLFVLEHRITGIGPTPRWTVSMHWLSYDAKTGTLRGSD